MTALLAASAPTFGAEPNDVFEAIKGAEGIQRVRVLAGSYFFRPRHIRVQAGAAVELTIAREPGLVPHDFVIDAPEAGLGVRATLGEEPEVIGFLPTVPGRYEFYCSKRFLFFESHKDKGMHGILEVVR